MGHVPETSKIYAKLLAVENNVAKDEKRIHSLELVSHGQSEAILKLTKPKKRQRPKPKPKSKKRSRKKK